jgi:cAMP-specific phosphodiesterase 4
MIEGILATDMASHVKHLNSFKSKLESLNIKNGENVDKLLTTDVSKNFENQQLVLSWCIHTADVSNPAKPIDVYDDWVSRVFIEFFNQGDAERKANLTISPLCDRYTIDVEKSQIGFINFVVLPTFEVLLNVIPEIGYYMDKVKENFSVYEKRVNEKEIAKKI